MATINCKLKRPGQSVKGLRVAAFEETGEAIKSISRYSRSSSKVIKYIGEAYTNTQGECKIQYISTAKKTTRLKTKVFIRVYEGDFFLGEKSKTNNDKGIRFVYEIGFPEPKNLTVITVINSEGEVVEGAEVYWRGMLKGKTDHLGHLVLKDVKVGDKIAARLLSYENRTSRQNHDQLSDHHWNYRAYITSVPIQHNSNGDDIVLPLHVVDNPSVEQIIQLNPINAQIGLNIVVSFEWDATIQELLYFRDRMFEVSELMYNATDGQFLIEHLVIADDKTCWNEADFRIYASESLSSHTYRNSFFGNSEYIYMNPFDALNPGALLHELGHYAFGLGDEDNGKRGCTSEGVNGNDTMFAEGGEKEACIMRGTAIAHRSLKLCSTHSANPHVNTTNQGSQDCWTTVLNRFNGFPNWIIQTPQSRNAIVGRLPDSGVPIARITTRSPWTRQAASFIPVFSWKPLWHFEDSYQDEECHNLKLKVLYFGEPEDDARVTIKNSAGRTILQGYTGRKELLYRDGMRQNEGEIIIRGAHKGDIITVSSSRLLIIETIQVSGEYNTIEINFEGWQGGSF